MRHLPALLLALVATSVSAQGLDLPGNSTLTVERFDDPGQLTLAIGPFSGGALPSLLLDGALTTRVWRIDAPDLSSLDILLPLRDQFAALGFEMIWSCATEACGGFDFRYNLAVVPPPDMHVDIGDFRYAAFRRAGDGPEEYAALLVSRSLRAGFVQVLTLGPPGTAAPAARATAPALGPGRGQAEVGEIGATLEAQGHVILSDLAFGTGSAQLDAGDFASLRALADYLAANPGRRIALVGHTDAVGSLEANIALSRRRAASVLERLVADHGVPRARVEAEGMGYLAPIAPNTTPEGREANRRVEAILLSGD